MPVIFATTNLAVKGGTQRVAVTYANASCERRPTYLLSLDGDGCAYDLHPDVIFESLGARVRKRRVARSVVGALRTAAFAGRIRAVGPSHVVTFLARTNLANVVIRRSRFVSYRAVLCERNFNSIQYAETRSGRALLLAMRTLYPWADMVTANSEALADDLVESFRVRRHAIRVVPNPVDLTRFRGGDHVDRPHGPRTAPVVLYIGRLIPQKDMETWIHAAAIVHHQEPLVRFRVAGEGPCYGDLRRLTDSLGFGSALEFCGWTDQPEELLRECTCFALSSRFEGSPNAVLEAMAVGVAVVATDAPGGTSALLGNAGLLSPPGDAARFAANILSVIRDPALRDSLGRRALERAEAHDVSRAVDEFEHSVGLCDDPRSALAG